MTPDDNDRLDADRASGPSWSRADRDSLSFVDGAEAFESIPCEAVEDEVTSAEIRRLHGDRIVVDAIHSGDLIPQEFKEPISRAGCMDEVIASHIREKDWGADHLAHELARRLCLDCSHRVSIARTILDFGRFPGTTRRGTTHMHRFAINRPFSECLSHREKRRLLEVYYDGVSAGIDRAARGKHIKLSIHSYDRFNPLPRGAAAARSRAADDCLVGTERPLVSLVFGSHGYHNETEMPYGVFDELFPDEIGELTADRKLTARILLEVANAGYSVAHNHPYLLPEGSVEVRSQVWFFFDYLRKRFEIERPRTRGDVGYKMVWDMLLDTNLRRTNSQVLRSYLHGFRKAPTAMVRECEQAEAAYGAVHQYVHAHRNAIVDEYRHGSHTERPSSLVVEVRKDLLWRFEDEQQMFSPAEGSSALIVENVEKIAKLLRDAVLNYLRHDR